MPASSCDRCCPGPCDEPRQSLLAGWQDRGDTIQVPALWYYEITSALSKGVTFKEFSRDQAEEMLALITEFDFAVIVPDAAQVQRAFDWTLRLRRAQPTTASTWRWPRRPAMACGPPMSVCTTQPNRSCPGCIGWVIRAHNQRLPLRCNWSLPPQVPWCAIIFATIPCNPNQGEASWPTNPRSHPLTSR